MPLPVDYIIYTRTTSIDSVYQWIYCMTLVVVLRFNTADSPTIDYSTTHPLYYLLHHDLLGQFQSKLQNMNICIYNAIIKDKVFKQNSIQYHIILGPNFGNI